MVYDIPYSTLRSRTLVISTALNKNFQLYDLKQFRQRCENICTFVNKNKVFT